MYTFLVTHITINTLLCEALYLINPDVALVAEQITIDTLLCEALYSINPDVTLSG